MPRRAHARRPLLGDELAVGENLEVTIGVLRQHVEQLRMHEGLAADHAEEDVAHRLGLAYFQRIVDFFGLNDFLLGRHVHPAPLAAQVATVDDRNVQKRRKNLAGSTETPDFVPSTDNMPFRPMFQASFQSARLSVSRRKRLAICKSMGVYLQRAPGSGGCIQCTGRTLRRKQRTKATELTHRRSARTYVSALNTR